MDEMIEDRILRRIAAEQKVGLDLIEKDYVLGWLLKGISSSSISGKLIFKGGTALSKVYFPLNWRISEDLDFTLLDDSKMEDISSRLQDELPQVVDELSGGIRLHFKDCYVKQDFLRVTASFIGPITQHRTKIEVTREKFIGDYIFTKVPVTYDYPEFSLLVYTLHNILAEKLRSLIERTKIRDYYDSWKLLEMSVMDVELVRKLFFKKCEGKGIEFKKVDQFFRDDLIKILEPHLDELTRMTTELLPPLRDMISDLKSRLEAIFL